MTQTSTQFKIGLFVLAGVALVVAGLVAFGLRRKLERKIELETYVTRSIDGLAVGSAVKLRGVVVGEVTSLGFSWNEYPGGKPRAVVIHFSVKERALPVQATPAGLEAAAREGFRAVVESEGLTGLASLSLVDLDPTRSPPLAYSWRPNHGVVPSAQSQLNEILASVQGTFANLQRVDVERLAGHLDRVLASANRTLQRLDQLDTKRLSRDLDASAQGITAASGEIRALAQDARGTLRGMRLEDVGRNADGFLVELRESNARLQRLLDRFATVDTRDLNATLAGTRQAARELNEAIDQLKQYPSGFLFGKAPPPARSVEETR